MIRIFISVSLLIFSSSGFAMGTNQDLYTYQVTFEQGKRIMAPCSGVFVSSFTMLTAAHCVDHLILDKPKSLHYDGNESKIESIFIPLKFFDAKIRQSKSQTDLDRIVTHREVARYDLAVVNLKSAIDKKYKKVTLNFEKVKHDSLVEIESLKFTGCNNPNRNCAYEKFKHKLHILKNKVYMIKGKSFKNILTKGGDSGGPMYKNGTHELIGILRGLSATEHVSASIYTPVYLHKEFILKFAKSTPTVKLQKINKN